MICISVGMLVECKVASPPLMPGSRKKRRRLLFCKPLPAHSRAQQSRAQQSTDPNSSQISALPSPEYKTGPRQV